MFGSIFSRGPKISRPVIAPTVGNMAYPGTPIVVQPPTVPGQGDPSQTIFRMLQEIGATTVGGAFFLALQAAGKQIGVRYGGTNNNQAFGAVRGYVLLRQHHDSGNAAQFGAELQAALTALQLATGHDTAWVADQLYRLSFRTWTNAAPTLRPFQNPPRPAAPVVAVGAARPVPPTPPQLIAAMIAQWVAGNGLPSLDQADALMILLQDYLNPGLGCATRITFDPHKDIVAGVARPPHCGLFHELVHAYYNALGRQLGREDSLAEGNGGRLFEMMAVGIGPFTAATFSENAFRTELGVVLRNTYP